MQRDAEKIRAVVAARREREDAAREVYLPEFLRGIADYGRAELMLHGGVSEDDVVLVELEVEEALAKARGRIEHVEVEGSLRQAGWGYLDGYNAAREAYQGRIAEAAWSRHVD